MVIELGEYYRLNNILPAVYIPIEEEPESEPSDFINDEIWNMEIWDNLGTDDSLPILNMELNNTLDDTLDSLSNESDGYSSN